MYHWKKCWGIQKYHQLITHFYFVCFGMNHTSSSHAVGRYCAAYSAVLLLVDLSSCVIVILHSAGKVKTTFVLLSEAALLLWWSYHLRAHEEMGESEQLYFTSCNWFVLHSQHKQTTVSV